MRNALRISALAAAALAGCPAPAALPPHYQRLAELRAVLANQGVIGALGGALIDRIDYVRTDLYRLTAGRCHVDARIVDLPTPAGLVGARRFEVRAGERVCAR